MKAVRRFLILPLAMILAISLLPARQVYAQPELIHPFPPPNETLSETPTVVTLGFDRALSDTGSWVTVTNTDGQRVDNMDGHLDPADRRTLTATLGPMAEGRYVVSYHAVSLGGSVIAAGSYEFSLDLPDPVAQLASPTDGEAFKEPQVPVELLVWNFDFSSPDHRMRVYVDGELAAEVPAPRTTLEGIAPGVHELRAVLIQGDDEEELPGTDSTVTIAVAQPDPELEGRVQAAQAEPDTGLHLTPVQWSGAAAVTLLLVVVGILLGRLNRS